MSDMHDETPLRGRHSRREPDDDRLLTHDNGLFTHGREYRSVPGGSWQGGVARSASGPPSPAPPPSVPRHPSDERAAPDVRRRDRGGHPPYGERGYGERGSRGYGGQGEQRAGPARPYPDPRPRAGGRYPEPGPGRGGRAGPDGDDPYRSGRRPERQPDGRRAAGYDTRDGRYPAARRYPAPTSHGDPRNGPDHRYASEGLPPAGGRYAGDERWLTQTRRPSPSPYPQRAEEKPAGALAVRPEPYLDEGEDVWPPDDMSSPDDGGGGRHRRSGGGGSGGRRWVRYARRAGAVVGVLVLLTGGYVVYEYKHLDGNIKRVDVLQKGDSNIRQAAKQRNAENFLLIGSDTRDGANSKYGPEDGARSDTTILAHLSPDGDKAILISFPRDSWVDLPSCRQPNGQMSAEQKGMFNAAFSIGGPACTILTVQKLTGIRVTHYVQIDFTGFKSMVHALGGIDVCSTRLAIDSYSGLRLQPGNNHLDGEQALAYVRARHGFGDNGDLGRIQRQQRFLGAMMRKATGSDVLLNPVKLQRFLEAATKSVTMDKDTHLGDLKNLAQVLHGLDPARVSFVTPPIANPAYDPNNPSNPKGSRVLLDDAKGRVLYDSIINDQVSQPKPTQTKAAPKPTAPAANAPTITVAPQQVRLRVFNGTTTNRLAAQVSTAMSGYGFQVVETGNSPTTGLAQSEVRYGPGHIDEARTVAAAVPGAVLKEDPTYDKSVALFLGSNYSTTKAVQVGDTYRPSSGATTSKPAGPITPSNAIKASDTSCVS